MGKNKWVAGFGRDKSDNYDLSIVECCEYNGADSGNSKFSKFQTFDITNITVNNKVFEFGIPMEMHFVNNITFVENINGT